MNRPRYNFYVVCFAEERLWLLLQNEQGRCRAWNCSSDDVKNGTSWGFRTWSIYQVAVTSLLFITPSPDPCSSICDDIPLLLITPVLTLYSSVYTFMNCKDEFSGRTSKDWLSHAISLKNAVNRRLFYKMKSGFIMQRIYLFPTQQHHHFCI